MAERVHWSKIVEEARTYLGTPFKHQGRVKGAGVDCIGLLQQTGKTLGLLDYDNTTYGRLPRGNQLCMHLDNCMLRVLGDNYSYGDVLVFWFMKEGEANHVGIATPHGMIHTYAAMAGGGKVVENTLDNFWQKRLMGAYRYKGMQKSDPVPMPISYTKELNKQHPVGKYKSRGGG